MEPILYLAGFNLCLLTALFCGTKRNRLFGKTLSRSIKGLAVAVSVIFMIGLVATPTHAAVLVEYWYAGGPMRPWDIACDVSNNRAFFTEPGGNRIGLIEFGSSRFTWWPIPSDGAGPYGITLGTDIFSNTGTFVWFTEESKNKIARLNPITGEFLDWTLPNGGSPRGIFYDKQNNTVWFTEFTGGRIGSLTYMSGTGWVMREYTIPAPGSIQGPESIIVDRDGIVWFTEYGGHKVSRLNPRFGEFTQYPVYSDIDGGFSAPWGIAVDRDGFIWFTSTGKNRIGRLNWWKNQTIGWTIPTAGSTPHEIAVDNDYNVWFTEFSGGKIGKLVPGVNAFYEYPTPTPGSQPHGLCIQEPGTIVFTEAQSNRIGRVYQPAWMATGGDTSTTTVNWISTPEMTTMPISTTTAYSTNSFTSTPTLITNAVSNTAFTSSTQSQWSTTSSTYTETMSVLYTTMTSTSTTTSTTTTASTTTTTTTSTQSSTSTLSYTTHASTTATTTTTSTSTSTSTITITMPTTSYSTTVTMMSVSSITSTSTSTALTTMTTGSTATSTVMITTTTTVTSSPAAPTRQCVIASAAYGSELAEPVQFLRGFRDGFVQLTFAGSKFMNAFNAFYYSFSPSVANVVGSSSWLQSAFRVMLYPLVASLHVAANMQLVLPLASEMAVVSSGIVASALIGTSYGLPAILVTKAISKRIRR